MNKLLTRAIHDDAIGEDLEGKAVTSGCSKHRFTNLGVVGKCRRAGKRQVHEVQN